jgi:hypothetical protein
LNQPPYIITEVGSGIVAAVAAKLDTPVNYLYGYVKELNETLVQYNGSRNLFDKKFPLIWLAQPFTITAGKIIQYYGEIDELRLFIITGSTKNWKASERMEKNYKPILYAIFYELINQMALAKAFIGYQAKMSYKVTDRYYWGEDQQNVLNDVVDIMEVKFFNIKIQNNLNC